MTELAFATGQAAWQDAVNANGETLRQAFALSDGKARMGSLSFSIDSIKQVLSAVGVRFVRVDFLLSSPLQAGNFTAVLYALNEKGERLTAYYGPASAAPIPELLGDFIIPTTLASLWLTNWKLAEQPDKPMFMTTTTTDEPTPLLGFQFEVDSIVSALFIAGDSASMMLLLGLHSFLGPETTGGLTSQFGVILTPSEPPAAPTVELYHDLAMPCPPY